MISYLIISILSSKTNGHLYQDTKNIAVLEPMTLNEYVKGVHDKVKKIEEDVKAKEEEYNREYDKIFAQAQNKMKKEMEESSSSSSSSDE